MSNEEHIVIPVWVKHHTTYLHTQVGAVTNTFNVPGVVGNCFFLKTAEDAKAIRERVNACFELANLPDSTEEDRKRLLSFVVVYLPLFP